MILRQHPGHAPEHLALVVTDRTRGPEPLCGRGLSSKPMPHRADAEAIRAGNAGAPVAVAR
jgi:hypothetical protein